MKISKINSGQNFNARLCGDYRKIIEISKAGGLTEEAVNKFMAEIHAIVPNPKDRVFFIFRKPYDEDFWHDFKIRSQIQVFKEGDILNSSKLRASVYPFKGEQKDLLGIFVHNLKQIFKRKKTGDLIKNFHPEKKHPWIYEYQKPGRLETGWVDFDEGLETAVTPK